MFSETVDRIVERSKRPDQLLNIADYVNASLRSLHAERDFGKDSRETQLMPHGHFHGPLMHVFETPPQPMPQHPHNPHAAPPFTRQPGFHSSFQNYNPPVDQRKPHSEAYVWQYPRELRRVAAVRFDRKCFSQFIVPSRAINKLCHYHYISGDNYVFVGWKHVIDIYWYAHPRYLRYYTPDERPAVFDRTRESFAYLTVGKSYMPTLGNEHAERGMEELVYDWMLAGWQELVIEMALAMLYAQLKDDRANDHMALAEKLKARMIIAEHGSAKDG